MNSDGYIPLDSDVTPESGDNQTNPHVIKSIFTAVLLHLIILVSYIIKHIKDKTNKLFHIAIVLILYFLKLYTLRILNKSDPGVIPSHTGLSEYLETNVQAKLINVNGYDFLQKWCQKCKIYRPPRAKHCYICNRCIRRFDHHCYFLSNCIGHNNYKKFVFFIFLIMVIKEYSFVLLFKIIQSLYSKKFSILHKDIYVFLFKNHFFLLIYTLYSLLCSLAFFYMNALNKYLILKNLTTYEYTYKLNH
eukprot:XP_765868.1 hypothetical protein [Theileria parva strain Muguga]